MEREVVTDHPPVHRENSRYRRECSETLQSHFLLKLRVFKQPECKTEVLIVV